MSEILQVVRDSLSGMVDGRAAGGMAMAAAIGIVFIAHGLLHTIGHASENMCRCFVLLVLFLLLRSSPQNDVHDAELLLDSHPACKLGNQTELLPLALS
eukprot:749291-Hanusia_phi.AAC.7